MTYRSLSATSGNFVWMLKERTRKQHPNPKPLKNEVARVPVGSQYLVVYSLGEKGWVYVSINNTQLSIGFLLVL